MTTLFFATDVHGSDTCWRKFIAAAKFYGADLLVLGGDMTGKALVPIIAQGNSTHKATLLEQEFVLEGEGEVRDMEKKIKSRGYYPIRTTPDEIANLNETPERVHEIFLSEALKTVQQWMDYAAEKLDG